MDLTFAAAKHANMIGGFDAVYWQGDIYIVADAMTAEEAKSRYLGFILGHEGGHHVARMLFPDAAERHEFFSAIAKLAPEKVAAYLDKHGLKDTDANRVMAAEEVAVDMVGESLASMKGALKFRMQQFLAKLRKFLVRIMPERFEGASDQMLIDFVAGARAAIRRDGDVAYGPTGDVAYTRGKETYPRAKDRVSGLVVFSPNQIKSATGNSGQFSKDTDDIRFHRKPLSKTGESVTEGETQGAKDANNRPGQDQAALLDADRVGIERTALDEAAEQIRGLVESRVPQQTIVTIKEAQDWLERNGFPRIAANDTLGAVEALVKNPEFKKLNVFDQIRVAAQVERPLFKKDYSPYDSPPRDNSKTKGVLGAAAKDNNKTAGSGIKVADTVVGCDHYCFNCYGLKGAKRSSTSHQHPVRRTLGGTLKEGETLRIGEVGDPSRDWEHTHNEVSGLLERSKRAGQRVTADNVYYITKLLNLDGFNPATARNLQVTLDPMYPAHMTRTMENILRLKAAHPEVNVVARIRSFVTSHPDLIATMDVAQEFANRFKLPVLETRMRFQRDSSFEILKLDRGRYYRELNSAGRPGSQWKLKGSVLKDESNQHYLCDANDGGCPVCKNCLKSTLKGRDIKAWKQAVALHKEGVNVGGEKTPGGEKFDPVGGDDIRFHRRPEEPDTVASHGLPPETWFEMTQRVVQDKMNRLAKAVKIIEARTGQTLPDHVNAALRETLYSGRTTTAIEDADQLGFSRLQRRGIYRVSR